LTYDDAITSDKIVIWHYIKEIFVNWNFKNKMLKFKIYLIESCWIYLKIAFYYLYKTCNKLLKQNWLWKQIK